MNLNRMPKMPKNTDKAYGHKVVTKRRLIPNTVPIWQMGDDQPIDFVHGTPEVEEYEEYE